MKSCWLYRRQSRKHRRFQLLPIHLPPPAGSRTTSIPEKRRLGAPNGPVQKTCTRHSPGIPRLSAAGAASAGQAAQPPAGKCGTTKHQSDLCLGGTPPRRTLRRNFVSIGGVLRVRLRVNTCQQRGSATTPLVLLHLGNVRQCRLSRSPQIRDPYCSSQQEKDAPL